MKKLIEALHVIQDECKSHGSCNDCPLYGEEGCKITDIEPSCWQINDNLLKALL